MRKEMSGMALAAVVAALGAAGCPSQRLQNGHLTSFGRFGRSISISGQTAAVGAYQEDGAVSQQGAVYIYLRSGDVWNLQARLAASDGAMGDQFGDRLALSDNGDTLAVSATLADAPGANHPGVVYLFQRTGTSWTQQAKLAPPSTQAFQAFGDSLALDGDRLVVGAPDFDQGTVVDAGAAYIYDRTGSTWGLTAALSAPSPLAQDTFGVGVAVIGNTVFVGAPHRRVGDLVGAGAVFLYGVSGTSWTPGQTVTANDAQAGEAFGSALAVSASTTAPNTQYLVVGAIDADVGGGLSDAGAAYVFTSRSGGAFARPQKLTATDAAVGAFFGTAVAISGDRVLVGAPAVATAAVEAGAAYVFDRTGASWSQTAELVSATGSLDDHLGLSVAISGTFALAGATEEQIEPGLTSAGAVHAFREGMPGVWSASHRLAASVSVPADRYGGAVAVSSDTLVAAANDSVDVYRRDPDGWSLTQQIPGAAGAFISSVSTDGDRLAFFTKHNVHSTEPPGTVEVYVRGSDGSWSLEADLDLELPMNVEPQEAAMDGVVVLSGDKLAAGAPRWADGKGLVMLYTRSGSTWSPVLPALQSAQESTRSDLNFGHSLALDGDSDTLIIDEPNGDGAPNEVRSGQVHVYSWDGSTVMHLQSITAPTPADRDDFGRGVALSGNYLAIRGESPSFPVRVYRRSGSGGMFSVVTWTLSGSGVAEDTGVGFDGDRLAIGVPTAALGSTANAGAVHIYQKQPDDTFVQSASWIPFDFAAGNQFGTAVAFAGGHAVATNAPSVSAAGEVYGTDP